MTAKPDSNPELLHLSTAALPERERLTVWREVYGRLMFNMDMVPIGEEPFRAEVALRRLPGANISMGWRSPADFRITRRLAATATDGVGITTVLKGGRARALQLGREEIVEQGGALLITTSDVGTYTSLRNGQHLTIVLPREALTPLIPDLSSRLMRPLSPDSSALKLMIAYATAAMDLDASAEHDLQRHAAVHLRDLIVFLAGMREQEVDAMGGGSISAVRRRVLKREIESQLGRHDMSAETLALSQQISPGYVRKLFRDEGTGFTEYVLARRLARARAMLADPLRAGQRIASIAFEVGFNDLSYFNRTFRRLYGIAPSDLRHDVARSVDRARIENSR
jgi:AraC-like DNA-binding protein